MNEGQVISLVAVIGALILVGSGYRSYRVGGRKTLMMAMIWIGVFILAAAAFGSMQ